MNRRQVVAKCSSNTIPPFFPSGEHPSQRPPLPPPPPTIEHNRWAGLLAHNRWLAEFLRQPRPGRRAGMAQVFSTTSTTPSPGARPGTRPFDAPSPPAFLLMGLGPAVCRTYDPSGRLLKSWASREQPLRSGRTPIPVGQPCLSGRVPVELWASFSHRVFWAHAPRRRFAKFPPGLKLVGSPSVGRDGFPRLCRCSSSLRRFLLHESEHCGGSRTRRALGEGGHRTVPSYYWHHNYCFAGQLLSAVRSTLRR